jgi:hypothetical protein
VIYACSKTRTPSSVNPPASQASGLSQLFGTGSTSFLRHC